MEELYLWIADNMNYGVITLFMAIESSFIPFPSEIIMIPAAYVAINEGTLSLPLIILFGTVGAIIGALVNYGLAYGLGRHFVHRFADTRLSHMLLIDRPGVEKAEDFFARHGAIGTFVGRLIPAIRQLISIPAGMARMNLPKFIFFTFLGAGLWNTVLVGLGAFFGHSMPEDVLIAKVQEYSNYVKVIIAAIILVGLVYYIYKVIQANRAVEQKKSHQ
ncbi:MAG: DedA family protein [Bacteroidales bacterium]|nr:DedA family protein [Bacteroidales bacterium]